MEKDLDILGYVKSSNSLRKKEKIMKIKKVVVHELGKSVNGQTQNLREHNCICGEVIKKIMLCLEELVDKKKYDIDKFKLLIEICNELFGSLNPIEIENIKKQVEFNLDNGLIKKYPIHKYIIYKSLSFLKKKFID